MALEGADEDNQRTSIIRVFFYIYVFQSIIYGIYRIKSEDPTGWLQKCIQPSRLRRRYLSTRTGRPL